MFHPKFYEDDATLWLRVVEAMFSFWSLSEDKRKCKLILSALDHKHLRVLEFPLLKLGEHPYDEIKQALLKHYAKTENDKLH